MGTFKIEGGKALKGEITPQGAKNEALQVLCPVLLTSEKVRVTNIPDIIDVNKLITLLGNLGVKIQKSGPGDYTFQADEVNVNYLKTEAFKKEGGSLRGSIMIVGPLLARFGCGYIPKPGGDKIGRRRLDTHFEGFINLGAKFRYEREDHFYGVEIDGRLQGNYMLLDEASVTGTNIPDIIDVNKLITLLGNLGVKIQKNGPGDYTFQADEVNVNYLKTEAFKK